MDADRRAPFLGLNLADVMAEAMQEMEREAEETRHALMEDRDKAQEFLDECWGGSTRFFVLSTLDARADLGLVDGSIRAAFLAVDREGRVWVVEAIYEYYHDTKYEPGDYEAMVRWWDPEDPKWPKVVEGI